MGLLLLLCKILKNRELPNQASEGFQAAGIQQRCVLAATAAVSIVTWGLENS